MLVNIKFILLRGHSGTACDLHLTEGFSHFVISMTAPIATGWSKNYQVGFAPTEKRCLCTAHAKSRLFATQKPDQTGLLDNLECNSKCITLSIRIRYRNTARYFLFSVEQCCNLDPDLTWTVNKNLAHIQP